jgi:hypothetical protein
MSEEELERCGLEPLRKRVSDLDSAPSSTYEMVSCACKIRLISLPRTTSVKRNAAFL